MVYFMLQTKFCIGLDMQDLQKSINDALSDINSDDVTIHYHLDKLMAIIEYQYQKKRDAICVDCCHYDPTGDPCRKAFGLCQFHGDRVRFSQEVCRDFLDVR